MWNAGTETQAPDLVVNRIALPSCGVEVAQPGGRWNEAGRACFWNAYLARRPAEFVTTMPTTEGDPITTIYRVLPDGSVEVFIDATRDRWGSGEWSRFVCRTLSRGQGRDPQVDFGLDETCEEMPIT